MTRAFAIAAIAGAAVAAEFGLAYLLLITLGLDCSHAFDINERTTPDASS